ncbi:hypothetical protein T4E_479 [Trichinella pseudospiralis]|uniref:Uncharacterized protein n=1 Tax=Trichinella pseudospiralis TaxID=6337 RepID=A0A0V0XXJ5_TRIPS|nr:hypothetical protein T4E_479 [Trichinella pseudospiralis]
MVSITAVEKKDEDEDEEEEEEDDDDEESQIIVRNPREVARVFGSSMTRNEPQECHSITLSLLGSPPPQATLSIDPTTNGSTQRSAIRKIKILTTQRGEKFFPMRRK